MLGYTYNHLKLLPFKSLYHKLSFIGTSKLIVISVVPEFPLLIIVWDRHVIVSIRNSIIYYIAQIPFCLIFLSKSENGSKLEVDSWNTLVL